MTEPWESAAPQKSNAPAPWESAAPSAPPRKSGILDQIGADFMAPINSAVGAVTDEYKKQQARRGVPMKRSLIENIKNAPKDIFDSTASDIKQLGNVANLVASPIAGALNTVTRPVSEAASNAAFDAGIDAYAPGGKLGAAPLSREQAAQQANGTLQTALSLGVPEKMGPYRVRPMPPRLKEAPIPSVDDLRAAKTAAYNRADSVGAVYHPAAVSDMLDATSESLAAKRLNPKLAPTSANLLDELQTLRGKPSSFHDLEEMRQLVGESVGPTAAPREKMYAGIIRNNIDDFLNNAGPQAMVAGDPAAQAQAINEARQANVTYRKAEAIQNALNRADLQASSTGTGGNIDNATRQKLRSLLLDKRMSWTPEEAKALNLVVRGGPVQNLLRLVGRLSPEGNGLMLAGHLAAAIPTHGMSAVSALAGAGAKVGAERMTQANVDALMRTVTNPARIAGVTPSANYEAIAARLAPPRKGPDLKALPPLIGASNVGQMPALLPYPLPLPAAAEPPRKRNRKK